MDRALTWFAWGWIVLAVVVNLISIAGIVVSSHGLVEAWSRVTEIFSPFNVINLIAEGLLLSPALIALTWRDRRRKKSAA